jgi:hypothetical protein
MTPTELWLPLGAATFYLYDSSCLLWQNELLFVRAGLRWRVAGGSELRLMGRRVYLPNPLQPQRAQFLVRWSLNDPRRETDDAIDLQRMLDALRPVRALVQVMMFLLLVALPLIAWTLGAGIVLLGIFGAFYLAIIAALIVVYRRRGTLHLTRKAFWSLAFDALACAPFAINMVRKITVRRGITGDPIAFASSNFSAAARAQTARLVRTRLDEEAAGGVTAPDRQQQIAAMMARLGETVS